MIRTLEDIKGLSVTIMGLGLNGGGLASTRFFAERGAAVTVTDLKTEAELAPSLTALEGYSNIRFVLGQHCISDFSNAELVIKNPDVTYEGNQYLAAAKCIETDISFFLRFTQAPVIAVTGSKGKSSTVSAIHHGLRGCSLPAFLGGNITVSPLTFLTDTTSRTPVVLELSSWQLRDLARFAQFRPKIAVLTAILPDHQNRYPSMEAYVADKKNIYHWQDPEDYTICNYDDEWGKQFAAETKAAVYWYSAKPLPEHAAGAWLTEDGAVRFRLSDGTERQLLPAGFRTAGNILIPNLMAAALTLALYPVELSCIPQSLSSYPGIPHRLEYVHQKDATRFYNDSAATIPEAAAAAINAFTEPVTLITGGTDKKLDFAPLVPHLSRVQKLYLLAGTGTDKLVLLLDAAHIPYYGPFNSLDALLDELYGRLDTREKQVVVLSPGAASFGLFKNEFDRGMQFKAGVQARW
ncbi:MAG: UDP-N-acetylmuramoyl-L-alanine--D-glutamate ligase [Treponema sp.]